MNWNQLQYFVTIKEEKSISKAAEKLFISQPSLSLSLKALENEVGTGLLSRKKGELTLTYAGQLYYDWAVSTLKSHQQMLGKINEIAEQKRRLIRVGISPHRSQVLMPPILEQFYGEYPECEVILVEKPTYELRTMLEQGELDLMLDLPNPDTMNYRNELLAEEQILLAIPTTFPVEGKRQEDGTCRIRLQELQEYPFIMQTADQVMGRIARSICERETFHPDIRLTCYEIENAFQLCSRQLGIVFIPELYVRRNPWGDSIKFCYIDAPKASRSICLISPKTGPKSEQLLFMMKLFREQAEVVYSK